MEMRLKFQRLAHVWHKRWDKQIHSMSTRWAHDHHINVGVCGWLNYPLVASGCVRDKTIYSARFESLDFFVHRDRRLDYLSSQKYLVTYAWTRCRRQNTSLSKHLFMA